MARKKSNKHSTSWIAPTALGLAVWGALYTMLNASSFAAVLMTAAAGAAAGLGLYAILHLVNKSKADKERKAEEERARQEAEAKAKTDPMSPYSPEVQKVINEGRLAMKEMGRLYSSIRNPAIRQKINEIMAVSDKIVRDAIDDPSDVPQIQKFLSFYLPTTIKLLNACDRMNAQEISGSNISGSMARIEEMLDTSIAAYQKQLDALFANQAADIQMDIDMMNGMLAREGLGGKGYLDLNDFMREYEKQQKMNAQKPDSYTDNHQKGSTSNG